LQQEAEFLDDRDQVLAMHPSGAGVDLATAVALQLAVPSGCRAAEVTRRALCESRTLLQPRAGVATVIDQIAVLRRLTVDGGADVLPLTVDSYTRQLDFRAADAGWHEAERTRNPSRLNGFPAVSAGVDGCREIVAACERPVEVRHGAPDARLLAEITLAAGCTAFEGGGITYCIPYSRDTPLEQSLKCWRYVDRLCGWYATQGVVIEREAFGALTGILVPPSVALACSILELLLAAEQGVAAFAVSVAQGGEIVQDTAAVRALKALSREYLEALYPGSSVQLSTVLYQWMGPFPVDEAAAAAVIALGAATAAAACPTRMITKSQHEARGVPDAATNAAGLRLSRAMLDALAGRPFVDEQLVAEEQHWLEREARCLLDNVLRLTDAGPLSDGIVRAFELGQLDVPFAPSNEAKGRVLPVRDARRAIRFGSYGDLPFDYEVRAHNERKLASNHAGGRTLDVLLHVTEDLMLIRGKD